MRKTSFEKWGPLLLAIILISPLISLPRPTNISSIPWRVELLFSIFLIVCVFVRMRADSKIWNECISINGSQLRRGLLFLGAFLLWSALSTFWSQSPTSAIHHTLVWANYSVVLIYSVYVTSRSRGRAKVLYLFAAIALLIGVLACFDFLTLQDFAVQEGTLRIRYAKFAEMLITFGPLLFAVPIIIKSRQGLLLGLGIACLAWCAVMLSLSKGAFLAGSIGIAVSFLLIAFFKARLRRRTMLVACVWFAITLIFQLGFSYLTSIPSTAEYISGSHQSGPDTSDMRVFTWKVARQMFVGDPIFGVGGDNFGLNVNDARTQFSKLDPDDVDSAIGEDYIFERAHNEIIQIACELGSIGLMLFVGFVVTFVFVLVREVVRRGRQLSPLFYGAIGGLAAFGASSMVSSFSFRAFQNGLIFMIVLGFAASHLKTRSDVSEDKITSKVTTPRFRSFAISFAAMLAVFSLAKAVSQYVTYFGGQSSDVDVALAYFDAASRLDPDNPGAALAAAESLAGKYRWAESVPHFRKAIDRGFGVSIVYSYLANAQEMSGDLKAAEQTLREASEIFPRSTFIRTRLAIVLEKLGEQKEADDQMSTSRSIDERQTNGWYSVIKYGILKAHLNARDEPANYAAPPDLLPAMAIHAYNFDKVRVD